MKSHLHSLDDSESVLLMYLFDELPEDDRAELESMLRTDGGLRTQLEQLRASHELITGVLAAADESADKRNRSVQLAQRNAFNLLKQWTYSKTIDRPAPREVSPIRRFVLYPAISVAAMLMLGLILWGIFGPPPRPMIVADLPAVTSDPERDLVAEIERSWAVGEVREEPLAPGIDVAGEEMLVNSLDNSEELIRDAMQHVHLSDAESQLAVIGWLMEENEFQ